MSGNVLVTGGCGFIGSNLVSSFLQDGRRVTVFDSLARKGSEHNLTWLQGLSHPGQLDFVQGDIRDFDLLRAVAASTDTIYHLAAQVAVTTSVEDPRTDYETNATGTLNMLEAARHRSQKPTSVLPSPDQVYWRIEHETNVETKPPYTFTDLPKGIPVYRALALHPPDALSSSA